MSRQPRASGYFRIDYAEDLSLIGTRLERASLATFVALLLAFPLIASPFQLDLACQVFLACIGSLSLMLLTGYAGLISLGHAGLLCAGAFTAGILFKEFDTPIWLTLPAAAIVGDGARHQQAGDPRKKGWGAHGRLQKSQVRRKDEFRVRGLCGRRADGMARDRRAVRPQPW